MGIQRRVALIGSGTGPWISTLGLREPIAKVTGMKEGGKLMITMTNAQEPTSTGCEVLTVDTNGKHVLREARWMRVDCVYGGRTVICDILSKKVA